MKKNWKIIYLVILTNIAFIYLIVRWSIISNGNATIFDSIIGIIFLVLLLSPLFSEINLLGFSFKTDLKELKNDLRNEILNLRSEINNNINFNPNFDFSNFASPLMTNKDYQEIIAKNESGPDELEETLKELNFSEETSELFKIRYALELKLIEVSSIIKKRYPEIKEKFQPPIRALWYLQEDRTLNDNMANAFRFAYSMSSRAIHGEKLDQNTIKEVKELAPALIHELDKIIENEYH